MADRESSFVVSFEGTGTSLQAFLALMKRDVRATVLDMQSAADSLQLFENVRAQAQKAAQAFFDTKKRVDDLKKAIDAIEGVGGTVGKDLAKQMRDAEKAFAAATKELDKQKASLKDARANMDATSAATAKLAAEQKRLGEEWRAQQAVALAAQQAASKAAEAAVRLAQEVRGVAQAFQANKDALGFKTLRDVQPEVDKIRLAFQQLAASGKLSFAELGLAQNAANARIRELSAGVGSLGSALVAVRGSLLAFGAATAGIVAGAFGAASSFREFSQQLAAVGTISGATGAKLEGIGQRVRDLARDMGGDAVNATKALYDIIGSGFEDPNQALIILEQSMRAAIAGMTDTKTAASLAVITLNTFGLQATDTARVFDIMFKTADEGRIVFSELAANIGDVAPVAVAAGVSMEEVGAMFGLLTRNGRPASEAATQVRNAIESLNPTSAELKKQFGELNISLGNTVSTIEQLSKLPPETLGKLIPEDRARRALFTFTQKFGELRALVDDVKSSGGTMERFYAQMAATPQAKVDRFNSSLAELNLSIGEFVTKSAPAIEALTGIINGFNKLGPATKSLVIEIGAVGVGLAAIGLAFKLLAAPVNALVGLFSQISLAASVGAGAFTAAGLSLVALKASLALLLGFKFGEQLYEQFLFVRQAGDLIGITAGRIENALGFAQERIAAFFTGNAARAQRANEMFQRNADILDGMWSAAVFGATEKSRSLAEAQDKVGDAFLQSRDKIVTAASTAQAAISTIIAAIKAQVDEADKGISASRTRLGQFADSLREQSALIAKTAGETLATLTAATQAQIAALGLAQTTEIARTKAITEIQREAAKERLALLTKFAADSKAAFETEAASRLAIAGKGKADIERVERELTVIRKGSLTEVVNAFRAHVAELVQIQSASVSKIQEIDERRKAASENVEKTIREIRSGSATAYEAYAAKVSEIDRLISLARAALVAGDAKKAEEYATKVIGLAQGIATQVDQNGRTVVGKYEAQALAVGKLNAAEKILKETFDAQDDAARDAGDAAADGHKRALEQLREYEAELKRVNAQASADISVKIKLNVEGIEKELATLQALVTQKELLAPLRLILDAANAQLATLKKELEAGDFPVNITAKLDDIMKAINTVKDTKPELQVGIDKALLEIGKVKDEANNIEKLLPKLTIESNVDDVKEDIEKLKAPTENVHKVNAPSVREVQGQINNLTKDTSSTHTQFINQVVTTTTTNASGGPVLPLPTIPGLARGGPIRRFARGGPVLRIQKWNRAALEDAGTVPTAKSPLLPIPGFVRVVRGFARGGPVFRIQPPPKVSGVTQEEPSPAISRVVLKGRRVLRGFARGFATGGPVLVTPKAVAPVGQDEDEEQRGGRVARRFLRAFARGGPVFRIPAWNKVPGIGDDDTVPAALRTGSYVIRKSASKYYGDGLMRALALGRMPVKRFATGGRVVDDVDDDDVDKRLVNKRSGVNNRVMSVLSVGRMQVKRFAPASSVAGATTVDIDATQQKQPKTIGVRLRSIVAVGRTLVKRLATGGRLTSSDDDVDDDRVDAPRLGSKPSAAAAAPRTRRNSERVMSVLALARMPVKRLAAGGGIGGRSRTRWDDVDEAPRPTTRPDGTTIFYNSSGGEESAFFGDVKAGTKDSQRDFQADIFGEPDLPKDSRKLERLILQYANEVIVAARQVDGSAYWAPAIRALGIDGKDYEQQPTAGKLAVILRRARGIGLNIGITTSVRRGFDVDGRRFHKKAARAPAGLANPRLYAYDFYSRGGGLRARVGGLRDTVRAASERFRAGFNSRRDTVRALLTPGEFVVKPEAVQKYGTKFMAGVNNMRLPKGGLAGMFALPRTSRQRIPRIPRGALDGMFAPPRIQRQRIQHFAEGGLVGDTAAGRRILGGDSEAGRRLLAGEVLEIGKRLIALEGEPRVMNRTQNNTFNLQTGGYVDEAWVRRFIIPVLDDMTKRKG